MKALIFDSSSIITLALNNLLYILPALRKRFGGHFLITPSIKHEIVDRPIQMRKFELEALMILKLIKDDVIEVTAPLKEETLEIFNAANSAFKARGELIHVMHEGEASSLALYNSLKKEGHKVALVIDERTTRMLCENPHNLRKLFERKLHTDIIMKEKNLQDFRGIDIIRSSELCFIAYRKGIIALPATPEKATGALLFAAKIKGCSISLEEIEKAKRLAQQ